MKNVLQTLVLLAGLRCSLAGDTSPRKPLYIGGLLPLTKGSSADSGLTALAGSMQAVEDINNRSDVLPDYELVVDWVDTEVGHILK